MVIIELVKGSFRYHIGLTKADATRLIMEREPDEIDQGISYWFRRNIIMAELHGLSRDEFIKTPWMDNKLEA